MRLIDAEALIDEINEMWKIYPARLENRKILSFEAVIDLIGAAPIIEAKPVVQCKDCKYNVANSKHEPLDITDYTDITCEYFMTDGMSPNDYCSQGIKVPVISMEDVPKIMEEMEK